MADTAAPKLVLDGDKPNGLARILHTVLVEKIDESPWKAGPAKALGGKAIRVHLTDRDEWGDIVVNGEVIEVRSGSTDKPTVTVFLDARTLPVLLGVDLLGHFPALWGKGGRNLLSGILGRRVKVRGLLTHPVSVIRILAVLGVPPGTVG